MKNILLLLLVLNFTFSFAQPDERISTIDFIEVLNDNYDETLFYYQNNWQQLRIKALEKGYINNYQLLETIPTEESPYSFILITTYTNKEQFDHREKHFQGLIKEKGGLKLLNDKEPKEFRQASRGHDMVKHWG